jgi:hypothetical protein
VLEMGNLKMVLPGTKSQVSASHNVKGDLPGVHSHTNVYITFPRKRKPVSEVVNIQILPAPRFHIPFPPSLS